MSIEAATIRIFGTSTMYIAICSKTISNSIVLSQYKFDALISMLVMPKAA